ncbi:unnamed protein product [Durusdinium trenchii]|uniref:Glycosyltransferase 2-like domain-containing protein n=1 Tax=Durusdinium trenchii TaxID=1381693 RepID=A0ABP0JMA1_9DINO
MAASVVPPTVAVIIPAMNEEKSLPTTLQSVLAQKPSPQEIVVVDPGSTDRTSEVASECGAQVLTSPRGRAVQMNAGARNTKADVLLFLHADTGLPEGAVAAIQVALCNPRVLGGCFELRFHEEEESWTLQLWSCCSGTVCCCCIYFSNLSARCFWKTNRCSLCFCRFCPFELALFSAWQGHPGILAALL